MGALDGKVVAVTGAARGIGREIALLAAREGAAVVVNDYGVSADGQGLDDGPAREVVAEIGAFGGRSLANVASISDPAGAQSVIDDAVTQFGRIDAVVNNAGFLRDTFFHKMSHKDWHDVINVHLNGSFYVSRAAATHFREQGSGAYVHFTSTSGLIGNVGQANYSAAKMGIVGLSQSIALDMERFGVRSNCVAPFAWSRMTAGIPTETEAERQRVERFKTMSADKVAPLVVFLASDLAEGVTNQIMSVRKDEIFLFNKMRPIRAMHRDGGWSAETIARDLKPAFAPDFAPNLKSADVFNWDPV
ncbi:SDR family oxidoreductase [Rhodobacterales bacterium HKCCE2091]|nr:SDR family oxidoreductase [Rhodobacterales bacterium HKCCE2091]